MSLHTPLPQTRGTVLVTDGGLETDLIFHHGWDLPAFAAFPLLANPQGRRALRDYFDGYAGIARDHGTGLLLESPTWRANPDWASSLGYDAEQLDDLNGSAIALLHEIRDSLAGVVDPVVVSGCIGPRGDGYVPGETMSAEQARDYHARQITVFALAGADQVSAMTLSYADEAVGVANAAREAGIPAAISFTVETDGRLPDGQPLGEAIEEVDAATSAAPAYFMVNCAHPTHFAQTLDPTAGWTARILGLRTNASTRSHAELDEALELDEGDPTDLGARHADLRPLLPGVTVLGGCCGTDHRHVREVAAAWLAR